jgi:hypothetical protein
MEDVTNVVLDPSEGQFSKEKTVGNYSPLLIVVLLPPPRDMSGEKREFF